MKLSCTLVLLLAVFGVLSAQETKYFEVGQKLTLKPNTSAVPESITTIRWKFGSRLVVDWNEDGPNVYGSFRNRTTLDPKTLQLEVLRLTLDDTGAFSLETNSGPVGTYDVEVLKAPPTPMIKIQPLVCNKDQCTLKCSTDTDHLGPVTYEWKKDGGEWREDAQVKQMSITHIRENFYCRLKTRVRSGYESIPVENLLYEEPVPTPDPRWKIVVTVLVIIIIAALIAVFAMVKCCPKNRCSESIINIFNRKKKERSPYSNADMEIITE